jgi:hypothetical protein
MRFHINPSYAPGRRLWLEVTQDRFFTEDEYRLFWMLNKLSIWHGQDKHGANYKSWEFAPDMEPAVRRVLEYLRYEEGDFELIPQTY